MIQPQQALLFTVGKNRYAMDILHLKEVGRMPALEQTPGGPPGLLGMIRMHGRPVRLFDLAVLLRERTQAMAEADEAGARAWLVVSHDSDGEWYWRVDAVEDIVDYDPALVVPANDPDAPCVMELGGSFVHLLTPELLSRRKAA